MEMYFGGGVQARAVSGAVSSPRHGRALLRGLLSLAESSSPGPAPSFAGPHVLLLFLNIAGTAYIGRQALARQSGLGEGAARTVLKKLKREGYVDVIRSGCFLTRAGKLKAKSIERFLSGIVSVPSSDLTMGERQAALALRGAAEQVRSGIEQRDSAIRIGATAATTYVVDSGRFTIPGGSTNCEKDFPGPAWSSLKKNLRPNDGDVVILCGARDEVSARLGALAAATSLL